MVADNILGEKLYDAAKWGDFEAVRQIVCTEHLNPDFNINYQTNKGNTAVYIASSWGFQNTNYRPSSYYEMVKFLIEHGADLNIANKDGETPLYIASSWGHHHIVHLLILHGANLNVQVQTVGNFTPLQIAAYTERFYPSQEIYKVHSKHHAYYQAKTYMEHVMKTGEYLSLLTEIEKDYKMLMAYSAVNPNVDIPDEILCIITKYNHFAVVKELLHAGADPNILDSKGRGALGKAANTGHLPMMKLLIEHGALLDVIDYNKQNIKDLAAFYNQHEAVKLLTKPEENLSQ